MKIALASRIFWPEVGGTAVLAQTLADEFCRQGHEVRFLTKTPASATIADGKWSFPLFRQPSAKTLFAQARWADALLQFEVGLAHALPFLLLGKPFFPTHHSWPATAPVGARWLSAVQSRFARLGSEIVPSQALAAAWGGRAEVIGNCYNNEVFRDAGQERTWDIGFVGRFVPDKGVQMVIEAMRGFKDRGRRVPRAIIMGKGPQKEILERLVADAGLGDSILFTGPVLPRRVAEELQKTRILAIPSRWNEPFGLTALEGLACGCVVVASQGGGLPEAGGSVCHYFANGDQSAFTRLVEQILDNPDRFQPDARQKWQHLQKHSMESVAARYLARISEVVAAGQAH